ncbi:MAG: GNAT family N-acetyltransferase [Pseudomonadota bacterium]
MTDRDETASIQILSSLGEIDAADWDALANPPGAIYNPFLSHAFLNALEESGSAVAEAGWLPQHLILERPGKGLSGVLPCYLKSHSQGEYVFDHGWADAFERAGGRYYPKLQCSIPFTPASGRRLLVREDADADTNRQLLANGLMQLCDQRHASSAHITFMPKSEWDFLGENGFLLREDQQFHWQNDEYETFDAFLETLASRKRKAIKKERRNALSNGIEIDWLTGSDLTEDIWDIFFEFYIDTGSRKWGSPYLTREFFSFVGERMADQTLLVMARREGQYVAGAINFIGGDALYGRHWGCIEDHPFLHFEVCYYQAIDYAIAHKKKFVEAGAQGAHKLARGYMPQLTYSAHHIPHRGFREAVEDYLERERKMVESENAMIAHHGPFRKSNQDTQ